MKPLADVKSAGQTLVFGGRGEPRRRIMSASASRIAPLADKIGLDLIRIDRLIDTKVH
jgi:hypothetical protein